MEEPHTDSAAVSAPLPMLPRIVRVEAEPETQTILATSETGERRRYDGGPLLAQGVFRRLADRAAFSAVAVDEMGGVVWEVGPDLSRDTSDCKIRRQGQKLLLKDIDPSGRVCCPLATTEFTSFARELLGASRAWQAFAAGLLEVLDSDDYAEYPSENLAVLAREVSVPEFRQRLDRLEALINGIPEDL